SNLLVALSEVNKYHSKNFLIIVYIHASFSLSLLNTVLSRNMILIGAYVE
ncbi:16081_t:CDS:1, partial [Racocetra persica]